MHKLDLTVIIPVHSVKDENFQTMYTNALLSIANNSDHQPEKVLIVRCPCSDVKAVIDNYDYSVLGDTKVEIIENPTGKSFQNQMNYAVSKSTTKYVTYLEFDDTYSVKWFKNVHAHVDSYGETQMFIPLVMELDTEGRRLKYSNEAAWAYSFTDEIGVYDHDTLSEYTEVSINGMVIDREFYESIGGLKTNIDVFFPYEFLLRVSHKGGRIQVIPHEGYKHLNGREGSLLWLYQHDENMKITPDKAQFWMNTARKEFYFAEDRVINFDVDSVNDIEVNDEENQNSTEAELEEKEG